MSLVRELVDAIVAQIKVGTAIRHARGVVVSSTIGTSVVTIDGGATQITAYNPSHILSLPVNTVVDLLAVGRKTYVIAAYGAVPVGGVVGFAKGPSSAQNVASFNFTLTVPVVLGAQYLVSGRGLTAQQTANAGVNQLDVGCDDTGLVGGSANTFRVWSTSVAAGVEMAGGACSLYVPAATRNTIFTLTLQTNAGTSNTSANNCELVVTRVA
jgi:hypothetical protein